MNYGGKTLGNAISGKAGTAARLCGALLISAGALAGGALAAPAAQAGTAARLDDCPESGAQERHGFRRDHEGHLTSKEAAAYDRELREALRDEQSPGAQQQVDVTVPVAVHIVHAENGTGNVSDSTVREQVAVLAEAFGGGLAGADTGFAFDLTGITRTANSAWFSDFAEHEDEIKSNLREGGAATLNLYIADLGEGVLGQATFPQEYYSDPQNDGVAMSYRTVPGGSQQDFDRGYTAVHETGHWLGLFHTFQNGCTEPGDYVDDTPYEAEQASGCPEGRDTCPNRRGDDPVSNFMDYSDDACMDEFTDGQAGRMGDHWTAFRGEQAQKDRQSRGSAVPLARH
ncbi:zinc metalloprotease [Streptomonospora wellingtoniae]|uniref:Zinc metalloprotease n=1 Tax=Streptomonospora wellingtoniae TaxID=3075544 RepID=A0ABU2KR44_9ACTN|nr:zinc metalloprotease [Streptomonospora sp. DSM 45055]MDT0301756.1 zinc metalloprotease [Streptomonospora sp. DSM 45055]